MKKTKRQVLDALEEKYEITHETPTIESQHITYYVVVEINDKTAGVTYSKGFTDSRDIANDEEVNIFNGYNFTKKEKEAIEIYVLNKIDWSEAD